MKIEITYNLTDLRELAKQFPDVTLEETEAVMDLVMARLEKDTIEGTPRGVGGDAGLAGNIFGETVSTGMRVRGILGTPVEYGEVIELGRRPGKAQPPIAALIPWVRSKLGITDEKEQRSVAFVIARKIGASGFSSIPDGAKMFQQAWDKNEAWVQDQLTSIGGRVTRRLNS
jgi:hypothetical protein